MQLAETLGFEKRDFAAFTAMFSNDILRYLSIRAATALRAWKHGWERQTGVRIWMFHGVVERFADRNLEHNFTTLADFRECLIVFRKLLPVDLKYLHAHLGAGQGRAEDGVLVTFDDGYRNNLAACEELAKHKFGAVIFVCPGIPKGRTIWTAEITLLILHGGRDKIEILGRTWDLTDPSGRLEACRRIRAEMKRLPAAQRAAAQKELEMQFPSGLVEELLSKFPSLQLLSLEEMRQLASGGFTIASHGMHHEIHHASQPWDVLAREIAESKKAIENATGSECTAFAYPNGDYTELSIQLLKTSGFRLAFTTQRGCLTGVQHHFRLPRMEGSRIEAAVRDAFYMA